VDVSGLLGLSNISSAVCFIQDQPFLVVDEHLSSKRNIGCLFSFISAAQQQHAMGSGHTEIKSIAWSVVDSDFVKPSAKRLRIAKVAERKAIDSRFDLSLRSSIPKLLQPIAENVFAASRSVAANFDHTAVVI